MMKKHSTIYCPSCQAKPCFLIGELPSSPQTFGGECVALTFSKRKLYECQNCVLQFNHPIPEQQHLTSLYTQIPSLAWSSNEARFTWKQVASVIKKYGFTKGSILDVGCFDGGFLSCLPNKFEKHGIEPHPKAATIAKTRNIKIISDSIEGLNLSQKYQCITLLDTVEHFVNPTDTLDRLIVGIEQGGVIVICSGATDTLQWRIMAPYYWYCCLPEHVSFLNRKYLEKYCAKNSLYLALYKKISSEESVFPMNLVQWLKALLYCSDFVFRNSKTWDLLRKIPRINKIRQWSSPPWLTMSKNHFIAVIQKK